MISLYQPVDSYDLHSRQRSALGKGSSVLQPFPLPRGHVSRLTARGQLVTVSAYVDAQRQKAAHPDHDGCAGLHELLPGAASLISHLGWDRALLVLNHWR